MTKEEFCEVLKNELGELTVINPDTNFKELDSFGSLSFVVVVQLIEDQFQIKVNPRDFRKVKTVNDIATTIGEDHFN